MANAESVETLEVADIDGRQLPDAMNIHARGQSGIMNLHALDCCARQAGTANGAGGALRGALSCVIEN